MDNITTAAETVPALTIPAAATPNLEGTGWTTSARELPGGVAYGVISAPGGSEWIVMRVGDQFGFVRVDIQDGDIVGAFETEEQAGEALAACVAALTAEDGEQPSDGSMPASEGGAETAV